MDSREIVQRTFDFQKPERVAHSFFPSDFVWCGLQMITFKNEWHRTGTHNWQRTDEWGNLWERTTAASKGKIIRGGLQDLPGIADFMLPESSNPKYYTNAKIGFSNTPDKWHIGVLSGSTFELAHSLRSDYKNDILNDISSIRILHDRIDELLMDEIELFRESGADSVMIIEDLGETTYNDINKSYWREEIKPRMKKLVEFSKVNKLKFIIHPFDELFPVSELAETGVDCIQVDKPRCIGLDTMETLQKEYKVTFWCPIDIEKSLQSGNEQQVRNDVREQMDKLWKGEGGFIAGYYWDNLSLGIDASLQDIASEEFLNYHAK